MNPNPLLLSCCPSYAWVAWKHAERHAGTQAGIICSVLVMEPFTTRFSQNLLLATFSPGPSGLRSTNPPSFGTL